MITCDTNLMVDTGSAIEPLPYFGLANLTAAHQVTGMRATFASHFVAVGDKHVNPMKATIERPIFILGSQEHKEYLKVRDTVLSLIYGAKRIVVGSRALVISALVQSAQGHTNRARLADTENSYTYLLDRPFWQSVDRRDVAAALAVGGNSIDLATDGDAPSSMVIEISGAGIANVTLTGNGSAFTWAGDALDAGEVLRIDGINGYVTVDGVDDRASVTDGSEFVEVAAGPLATQLSVDTDVAGNIVVTYHDNWRI